MGTDTMSCFSPCMQYIYFYITAQVAIRSLCRVSAESYAAIFDRDYSR